MALVVVARADHRHSITTLNRGEMPHASDPAVLFAVSSGLLRLYGQQTPSEWCKVSG